MDEEITIVPLRLNKPELGTVCVPLKTVLAELGDLIAKIEPWVASNIPPSNVTENELHASAEMLVSDVFSSVSEITDHALRLIEPEHLSHMLYRLKMSRAYLPHYVTEICKNSNISGCCAVNSVSQPDDCFVHVLQSPATKYRMVALLASNQFWATIPMVLELP